jgi:LysM repeat protein
VKFNVIPWWLIAIIIFTIVALTAYIIRKKQSYKKYLKLCQEYTVAENDTLAGIAKAHDTTWEKLAKINKLSPPYTLIKDQKILIPPKKNA